MIGELTVRDTRTHAVIESRGTELLALKDPAGGLFGSFDVAFSPDGTRLVSWGTEVIIS